MVFMHIITITQSEFNNSSNQYPIIKPIHNQSSTHIHFQHTSIGKGSELQ